MLEKFLGKFLGVLFSGETFRLEKRQDMIWIHTQQPHSP